jgi:hypothetical protein
LRVIAGLLSPVAGVVVAVLVLASALEPRVLALSLAVACLSAGYLGLSVTETPTAPLRPARFALILSIPPALFMLAALPWPPSTENWVASTVLVSGVVLSAAVIVRGREWPRAAFGAVSLMATYGAYFLARYVRYLLRSHLEGTRIGPAETLSVVLACSLASAWIAALWHSRSQALAFRSAAQELS